MPMYSHTHHCWWNFHNLIRFIHAQKMVLRIWQRLNRTSHQKIWAAHPPLYIRRFASQTLAASQLDLSTADTHVSKQMLSSLPFLCCEPQLIKTSGHLFHDKIPSFSQPASTLVESKPVAIQDVSYSLLHIQLQTDQFMYHIILDCDTSIWKTMNEACQNHLQTFLTVSGSMSHVETSHFRELN